MATEKVITCSGDEGDITLVIKQEAGAIFTANVKNVVVGGNTVSGDYLVAPRPSSGLTSFGFDGTNFSITIPRSGPAHLKVDDRQIEADVVCK